MANVCAVCGQGVKLLQRQELHNGGLACKACFEKTGLKEAGIASFLVTADDVVTLCDMRESEKAEYIEQLHERWQRANAAAAERQAAAPPPVPKCKKCGSTSISGNKKGYSIMTGFIGANKVKITCLNCGHQWMAGKK